MMDNLVEMVEDDCAFDQSCKFGNRCGGHAVYCHNEEWTDAPRKCRNNWYYGEEGLDEACLGYKKNE
jgi:hypothetical protein